MVTLTSSSSLLRLDDDLVAVRDVITVKLFVGIFHLLGAHLVAIVLIDVVESHL